MRASILAGILTVFGGILTLLYAISFPIYTDQEAPARLSMKLRELPREKRSAAWYSQLREFETPHKRISDIARGTIALGCAFILSSGIIWIYRRKASYRKMWLLLFLWTGLWAIQIPFSFWYYGMRQRRFDYPTWGDSITIPIYSEIVTYIIGAALTTAILLGLTFGRKLPDGLSWRRPKHVGEWIRYVCILTWMLFLALLVFESIPEGNEGTIISCALSLPILWIVLLADKNVEQGAAANP